jgi:hypothetical protein
VFWKLVAVVKLDFLFNERNFFCLGSHQLTFFECSFLEHEQKNLILKSKQNQTIKTPKRAMELLFHSDIDHGITCGISLSNTSGSNHPTFRV